SRVVNNFAAVRHVQRRWRGISRLLPKFFHSVSHRVCWDAAAIWVAGVIGIEMLIIEIRKSPSSADFVVVKGYVTIEVAGPFEWISTNTSRNDNVVDYARGISSVRVIISSSQNLSIVYPGHTGRVVVALLG